jgi:hypothetical protein
MRGSSVSLAVVVKFRAGYKTGRNTDVGYIELKKYIKENWNNFMVELMQTLFDEGRRP